MKVTVLFFATLKDIIGQRHLTLELSDAPYTVDSIRAQLTERFPQAESNLRVALAAINEEFAFGGDIVRDGDEIAFFPPVSGGDSYPEIFQLATEPVNHDAIVSAITTPQTGAICIFSGMVRGQTSRQGHLPDTHYLEYEAYEPMALAKMRQVADEIRQRWPLVQGIAIIQRIGRLEVGQNTILIACSSGHRDEGCFEAARYGIDRLKEIVPVWKKEVNATGDIWIEGIYQPKPEDRR